MALQIIKVDRHGKDATGEDYTLHAAPDVVARGHMLNIPTLIQWPNGKIETGNQVKVTPAGLEWLKRIVPLDMRDTEGSLQ